MQKEQQKKEGSNWKWLLVACNLEQATTCATILEEDSIGFVIVKGKIFIVTVVGEDLGSTSLAFGQTSSPLCNWLEFGKVMLNTGAPECQIFKGKAAKQR